MTVPGSPHAGTSDSKLIRIALWVAIGALIAAAVVCVVWVLIGSENDIVGRAFLTILLLAAFAGVALLDARLAARRPAWFALASMVTWVASLLIGAVLIWMPEREFYYYSPTGFGRFASFLLIVLILQLALLHARLLIKSHLRFVTGFTRAVTIVTIALVVIIAVMLVLPLMFWEFVDYGDAYWRAVVALAILAAVGTALVPLVNALFAPKKPRAGQPALYPAGYPAGYPHPPVQPWPTYADGVTPLPALYDGSPDWNAFYTGYPSNVSQAIAPVAPLAPVAPRPVWQPAPSDADPGAEPPAAPPAAPGYEGYPPPPPLPPRP